MCMEIYLLLTACPIPTTFVAPRLSNSASRDVQAPVISGCDMRISALDDRRAVKTSVMSSVRHAQTKGAAVGLASSTSISADLCMPSSESCDIFPRRALASSSGIVAILSLRSLISYKFENRCVDGRSLIKEMLAWR